MHEILRTLKVPGFGRLATTYCLNELADWCASIALAALVYGATGDALATTALFVGNRFLPAFLVPVLAARVEALPTARALTAIYVLEALVLLALTLSPGHFLLAPVVFLAFVDGTLAATARALTRSATVALMEPQDKLREGNATLNVVFSVSCAAGPVLGGVFVALTGEAVVLAVASALFLLQAVVIGGARELAAGHVTDDPWRTRLGEGFAYVRGHRFLKTLLLTQAGVVVLGMMIQPIYIVYAHESLHVGNVGYGALLAAWGAGMVIGSMIFARQRGTGMLTLIVLGIVAQGLTYVGLSVAPHVVFGCAVAVCGGIGNGVYWVAVVTAVQEATAEAFQTRVAGLLEGLVTAAPGVGFLLGGATASLFDPRVTLAIAGIGTLAAAAVVLLARALDGTPQSVVAAGDGAPEPAL